MASTRFKFIRALDVTIRDKRRGAIQAVVSYPAGHEGLILEEHAAAAEKAGVGQRIGKLDTASGNQDAKDSGSNNVTP